MFDRTNKTIYRTATGCIHRISDTSDNRERPLEANANRDLLGGSREKACLITSSAHPLNSLAHAPLLAVENHECDEADQ